MWTLSKALVESCENLPCSQEPGAESSAENCLDGKQSVQSKKKSTPEAYLYGGRTKDTLTRSRSGMTYVPLTVDRGEVVLTWFLAASRVSLFRSQESSRQIETREISGLKPFVSLERSARNLYSWKTSQTSFLFAEMMDGDTLGEYSQTWPNWGSMSDGVCSELTISAALTKENGSGLLENAQQWKGVTYPTPRARDHKDVSPHLPPSRIKRPGLDTLQQRVIRRMLDSGEEIPQRAGLVPEWVEWVMNWPTGWTGYKPLEMARFQQWLRRHGKSYGG